MTGRDANAPAAATAETPAGAAPVQTAPGRAQPGTAKSGARLFLALHALLLLLSLSSVCSKLAGRQAFLSPRFVLYYGAVIVLLGIYAIGWQQIIRRMPLSVAYANKGATLVWSLVFGVLVFGEQLRWTQVLGCALAVAGVVLFTRADAQSGAGGKSAAPGQPSAAVPVGAARADAKAEQGGSSCSPQ